MAEVDDIYEQIIAMIEQESNRPVAPMFITSRRHYRRVRKHLAEHGEMPPWAFGDGVWQR